MTRTLRFRLTASFLAAMLCVIMLLGIAANFILKRQFQEYIIHNLNKTQEQIVSQIDSSYKNGNWDISGIERTGMNALGDGLIVRVLDQKGTVLWDAAQHNSGMCASILKNMADNMRGYDAGFSGSYTEKAFTTQGGTIVIGYYGPYFYTDNDIRFLSTLNTLLIIAAVSSCLLAIVLGGLMAKRLSKPIVAVQKAADKIADGHYELRVPDDATIREITELTFAINAMTERLGKQEQLRQRLTADVAHELRTPMANLQGQLEAMLDGIWAPDEARLQSCLEETVRLTKIIGDLETLARFDSEPITLEKTHVDLSDVVTKALSGFDAELESRDITLTTDLTEQTLFADRDKMAQVLLNLMSNALKYTGRGGQIVVTLSGNEDHVLLSVKDNGAGIAKEDLPFIFERFYRADKSRSRDTGGSGIGLAIVKSIVTAHRGTIDVLSQPACGSEFIITLPKE